VGFQNIGGIPITAGQAKDKKGCNPTGLRRWTWATYAGKGNRKLRVIPHTDLPHHPGGGGIYSLFTTANCSIIHWGQ